MEAYRIFVSSPMLKHREFVSEQAARLITPTASAPGTSGHRLLQNYPTATLQLPSGLLHPPSALEGNNPLSPKALLVNSNDKDLCLKQRYLEVLWRKIQG